MPGKRIRRRVVARRSDRVPAYEWLPGSGLTLHAVPAGSAGNRFLEAVCQRRCERRQITNRFRKCLQCINILAYPER